LLARPARLIRGYHGGKGGPMTVVKVLLVLLAIWIAIAVIGVIVKGLFYLFVIGLVLFGVTVAIGAGRERLTGRRR
jgi:hypothetical protein